VSPFDYISVVLSVVIGLGLSHLLTGAVNLIQERERVRFYWVHSVWVVLTFVGIVFLWWSIWRLRMLQNWNFVAFLLLLLEPVLMFVAAAFLVPRPSDKRIDLREHYYKSRRGIFGAFATLTALLILQNGLNNERLWITADWYLLVLLALSVAGAVTAREKFHSVVVLCFAAWLIVFVAVFGFRLAVR
jgi:hypothetical protein